MGGVFQLAGLDRRIAVVRQNARQIVDQSAARDVRQAFQLAVRHFREQRL